MKVLGIAGQKGGGGKTTLTVNLAAWFAGQGFAVSVIDRDPQSAVDLWNNMGEPLPFPIHSDLDTPLVNAVAARRRLRDDIVVIDSAPSIGGGFSEMPKVADLILLVVRPAPLDVAATGTAYNELMTRFNRSKNVYAILNQVNPRKIITRESLKVLGQDMRIPSLESMVENRTLYENLPKFGHTVFSVPETPKNLEVINTARAEISGSFKSQLTVPANPWWW